MLWFFGHEACEILAPWPGIKLCAFEDEVLTTGLPAKSLFSTLYFISFPGLIVLAAASVQCWLAVLLVVMPAGDRPLVSAR